MMKYARRQLSSELITTVTKLTTPFVRKLNPEILTTFLFPFGFVSRNSSFTLSKYFTWKSSPKILSRSVVKKPNTKINRKDAPTCSKPKKRLNNAISRLPAKPPINQVSLLHHSNLLATLFVRIVSLLVLSNNNRFHYSRYRKYYQQLLLNNR